MNKTLVLVRHGKALELQEGQDDASRELSEAGKRALAATLPESIRSLSLPQGEALIWSSPALRALQTASLLDEALASVRISRPDEIVVNDNLWSQDADSFLQDLAECDADVVFAVGHNPFVESLTEKLTRAALPCATGGLVRIDVSLSEEDEPSGRLVRFAQGPVSKRWRTLTDIEETIGRASATVDERLDAFFANPDDPETMHKLRVSIRTLRSLVAFVKPWHDPTQNASLQRNLRDVVVRTSRLRELDVFAAQASASEAGSQPLVDFCAEQAREEREKVLAELKSKPVAKALAKARKEACSLRWKKRCMTRGLPAKTVRGHFDDMIESIEADLENLSLADTELTHSVRKKTKRARYAAENFGSIVGDDALGIAKGMTAHQDDLGAICDARVNIALIDEFLASNPPEPVAWDLSLLKAQNETFLYTTLRSATQS